MAGRPIYTAAQIARRVKELGRAISRDARGRKLDVVVTMDRSFVFAADLIRAVEVPVQLHSVGEDVRDVEQGGRQCREVYFASRSATAAARGHSEFQGRDVLLLDAVLDSGITQDFLLRRIGEGRPRSLRLAVLLDKTSRRRVGVEPDYFAFRTASNLVWTGYGLGAANGTGRNSKYLSARPAAGRSGRSQGLRK